MYCPECGFHQSEAHKYCGRCGALLIVENQGTGEITGPFAISDHAAETGEWQGPSIEGPTLAVGAGGPPGATFSLDRDTVTIGREPTADVFLDDVTVSRNHAVITRQPSGAALRDLGSLNGTYVNRRRIEDEELLEDGDELQIGKFRLTYLVG
ncbi:MAG TPA: FHA domain-containing protein [Miltoncostaeaceae bacterium]|nr:FHA domain-containing protein [Miltoncostaeaceae bacterium]